MKGFMPGQSGQPQNMKQTTEHPVRRLLRGGPQYLVLLTYAEAFGGLRPTLTEFRARLAAVSKVHLVRICAVLNAFLRPEADSPELFNAAAHRAFVRAYFSGEVGKKILRATEGDRPRVVFHRQQLLFVAKEALQYASDDASLPMISNSAMGELLLIANDLMHFESDDGSTDTLDSFAKLATTILPIQEAANGNVRHKILRSYQMTKIASELSGEKPHFDIFMSFKEAANLDLLDFYALVIGAISRLHRFDPEKFLKDPLSYSLDEQWFRSTKIDPGAVQAFFSLAAATPEEYKQRLETSRGPNDFTAFRDKPLLRSHSKLDLIDLWLLAEKFESGPFWLIHSSLPEKQRADFHSFWGRLFERYIADLFQSSADGALNRVYAAPVFENTSEELSDTVILCDRALILIESKGTTFTARAKYEGDYKLLRQELESKLVESKDRPQAVKQLARNIERAFGSERQKVEGIDLTYVTHVFPMVVTRDDLGGVAGVNAFLGSRFHETLNRKGLSVSVAPLICLSSEHAEALSAYLSDTKLVEILEAHIRANRRGQARYLTMPFFAVPNAVLSRKGQRSIPNQKLDFDELIHTCLERLGLEPIEVQS
jgi:hypothetical protein